MTKPKFANFWIGIWPLVLLYDLYRPDVKSLFMDKEQA